MRRFFYSLIARYVGLYVRPEDSIVELDPSGPELLSHFAQGRAVEGAAGAEGGGDLDADYVVVNGRLHYERDIQAYLDRIRAAMRPESRLIVIYHSMLWKPLISVATRLGWRLRTAEVNWLSNDDILNLLHLADFEPIRRDPKILFPVPIPFLAALFNRYLAPLPGFSALCMVNIAVARPRPTAPRGAPSVSVVVPARNEAGNIESLVARLPAMGPQDELIFVEGGSTDETWSNVLEAQGRASGRQPILATRQKGKGKGDAVRTGFAMASRDILMILDADLTVPPEDLPKFYAAIVQGKGEFVNGSRLVYPMERHAMRFANLIGNKFFATAFSFVLGQRFKDTLCGTKALSRENYLRLAQHRAYFGDFDPFGDFDLIFGAARMGLRIVEVPIRYRERTYGQTNISRWRHGAILLRMLIFAAFRLRFI